jgi:hypothetical protein
METEGAASKKSFRNYTFIITEPDYFCFLRDIDPNKTKSVFHYLQQISEIRGIWVNEFDV